jgi:PST family polysaccharide transporter
VNIPAAGGPVRRVAVSFAWLLADRGMRLIGGFAIGLWLARYLGPSDFGLLSAATAATWIGVVATQMGLDGLVQRELVQHPDNTGRILGTVTILASATAVVAWGGIAVLAWATANDPVLRTLLLWLGLLAVPQALSAWEYLFQARSDLRPVVVGQNICFVLCLAARAWAIHLRAPVTVFAVIAVLERLTGALVVIFWAQRRHDCGRLSFDPGLARAMIREAWPVWVSALLVTLYQKIDLILIARWKDEAQAGIYAAAMRIVDLWWSISTIAATAVLPDLMRSSRDSANYPVVLQRYLDLSATLAMAAAAAMTVVAHMLVRLLFGEAYASAAGILIIQFWAGVFVFLSVARARHLVAIKRRGVELWFSVLGVVLNLGLNTLLIPRYGAWGAAWSGFATQGAVALIFPWFFADTRPIAARECLALAAPVRFAGKVFSKVRASSH